jgi:small subunit ribosomal protein S2
MLVTTLNFLKEIALKNGKVLFVGTKRQAAGMVAEHATRCGQFFVNHRWLGGMLTNWPTVSTSIRTLQKYEESLAQEDSQLTKKEKLEIDRSRIKLERVLGGIRNMGGKPDAVFVIDTNKEDLVIAEAKKLGIPIIAVIDTNSNPDGIDYPIPGNDDAGKAIELYLRLASEAMLQGMQEGLTNVGVDLGSVDVVFGAAANIEIPDFVEPQEEKAAAGKKKAVPVVTKKISKAAKPKKTEESK